MVLYNIPYISKAQKNFLKKYQKSFWDFLKVWYSKIVINKGIGTLNGILQIDTKTNGE